MSRFERESDARTKCGDFSVLNLHVHFGNFGHAQISQ
jgi:hypothetical protein